MFWLKLAHEYKLPRRLLQRLMTWEDYIEEIAFYNLHPWGDDWLRTGVIASATLAPHVRKGHRAPKPDDFVPRKVRKKPRMTPQQMKAILFDPEKLRIIGGGC